jgi:hypothetical protein
LVRTGYEWLYKQGSPEVDRFFEASMESESDISRLRALYYFSKNRAWKDLESMLEAQLNKETYYYNVVTWLDRLLYSPTSLKEFFTRDLERQVT